MSVTQAAQVSRQLAKAGHTRYHLEEIRPGSKMLMGVPGFQARKQDSNTVRVRHLEQYLPSPNSGHAVALAAYAETLEALGYRVTPIDGRTLYVTQGGSK